MARQRFVWLTLLLLVILTPAAALGFFGNYAPFQPGFEHPIDGGQALHPQDTPPGLPLAGNRITFGATTIGEVDGNPATKEVLVGGSDGLLYTYRSNGSRVWQQQVSDCTPPTANGEVTDSLIYTAPAVADIDANGTPDVVIGYGTSSAACQGGVVAYDGPSGALLWRYAVPPNAAGGSSTVFGSPSIGNIDGKGDIAIAFGATNLFITVLNKDGSLRWRYKALDTVQSSPAFADVDGDGRLDVVVGTDFTPGNVCDLATGRPRFEAARGFLYAFPADPTFTPDRCSGDGGTTIGFGKGFLWQVALDQALYSSPAVADIDGDGQLEIAVGASCFYADAGRWVKLFTARTGALERTLNAPNCVASSPAIGDVNGDGKLDIVTVIGNNYPAVDPNGQAGVPTVDPNQGEGRVIAWSYDNPQPLWVVTPVGATGDKMPPTDARTNVVLADVDGNGSVEVVVVAFNSVSILQGRDGAQLTTACANGTAQSCPLRSLFMWYPNRSTPAVGDLDGDGKLEIAVGGSHVSSSRPELQQRAFLYAWRDFAQFLNSQPGNQPPYAAPWPQLKGNAALTGFVAPRAIVPSQSSLVAVVAPNRNATFALTLRNADGSSLDWTASADDPSGFLTLSPSSGTSADPLVVTVRVPQNGAAVQPTTQANITIKAVGLPDVTIAVTIIAGSRVYDTFVPLANR